jgi:hypothetical protein
MQVEGLTYLFAILLLIARMLAREEWSPGGARSRALSRDGCRGLRDGSPRDAGDAAVVAVN